MNRREAARSIRSPTHKLLWELGDGYALYALGTDWQEGEDLRPKTAEDQALQATFLELRRRSTAAWWR